MLNSSGVAEDKRLPDEISLADEDSCEVVLETVSSDVTPGRVLSVELAVAFEDDATSPTLGDVVASMGASESEATVAVTLSALVVLF